MDSLLSKLRTDYPAINFEQGDEFCWSPKEQIVYFTEETHQSDSWSLLHEVSHGILQHTTYYSDFELLRLEIAAWELAQNLASKHSLSIDEDHIEDCLDTYRDWLHKRSLCPTCGVKSLQINSSTYGCFNCSTQWKVTSNRLCRPYRSLMQQKITA